VRAVSRRPRLDDLGRPDDEGAPRTDHVAAPFAQVLQPSRFLAIQERDDESPASSERKERRRYRRHERLPRWRMTAHGGTSQAYKPWTRLVTRWLKRAKSRELHLRPLRGFTFGIHRVPQREPGGYTPVCPRLAGKGNRHDVLPAAAAELETLPDTRGRLRASPRYARGGARSAPDDRPAPASVPIEVREALGPAPDYRVHPRSRAAPVALPSWRKRRREMIGAARCAASSLERAIRTNMQGDRRQFPKAPSRPRLVSPACVTLPVATLPTPSFAPDRLADPVHGTALNTSSAAPATGFRRFVVVGVWIDGGSCRQPTEGDDASESRCPTLTW
jgi:hypothetical protein